MITAQTSDNSGLSSNSNKSHYSSALNKQQHNEQTYSVDDKLSSDTTINEHINDN